MGSEGKIDLLPPQVQSVQLPSGLARDGIMGPTLPRRVAPGSECGPGRLWATGSCHSIRPVW